MEEGWSLIDPRHRKNYRVIVHCGSSEDKRRAHLQQNLQNPSLKHQLENIEAQFQYLLKNIESPSDATESPSALQVLAAHLRSNEELPPESCREYRDILNQMRNRVKEQFLL